VQTADISRWQHDHRFHAGNARSERNTWLVVALTAVMMVAEIVGGWLFRSMALLADGWHMSTHAAALSVTGVAYVLARRHASDPRFAFGTWKMEALGGFASAVLLAVVALYMAVESTQRLFRPLEIRYDQALAVAALGLAVNLVSALLLRNVDAHHGVGHEHRAGGSRPGPDGVHEFSHSHGPHQHLGGDPADHARRGDASRRDSHTLHHHRDLNLLAAYTHVLADALTSLLAIGALTGGMLAGWNWLDPAMGLIGAGVISAWAYGLLRDTGRVLLDRETDGALRQAVRECIEADGDARVTDVHLLRVGPSQYACILALVASNPKTPEEYRAALRGRAELAHVTVEVARYGGG
jgi:cation diffusion facilitator family transporter